MRHGALCYGILEWIKYYLSLVVTRSTQPTIYFASCSHIYSHEAFSDIIYPDYSHSRAASERLMYDLFKELLRINLYT